MRQQKIILDAYQYAPAITGTDRMAFNFLIELQKIDSNNHYFVICSSETYIRSAISASNFVVIRPPSFLGIRFVERVINKLFRELIEYYLRTLKADIYYSFHNMRLPRTRVARRMIASNLDLIPLVLDEYKTLDRLTAGGQRKEFERVARIADAFMSISNFSKSELVNTLQVSSDKITVIPLAPDPHFLTTIRTSQFSVDLPKQFIMTIGGNEPRKNVGIVVQAFTQLPSQLQAQFPLLIVGRAWHGLPLKDLEKNTNIITLGYVDDSNLALMYQRTAAFIFASKYEGFGFTILEAMACGAPVLSATGSSLDEVMGSAAVPFEATKSEELAHKLEEILLHPSKRKTLVKSGFAHVKNFSWKISAKRLHDLLLGM
jgi:glycosyltransferase involved in cell wall biosynthesis